MADQPDSSPRPTMPFRLNLEQQRKRAKELLKALGAGEPEARRRFLAHHPQAAAEAGLPDRLLRLSEAQFVIARELGLPSWPRLKAHVLAMEQAWDRIKGGEPAPDGDMPTLHIRCGSDIHAALQEGGFTGDFLEYSNPICQGPVTAEDDWLDRRADFLAQDYGHRLGRSRERIAADLTAAETRLRAAAATYRRVVLWFEHDSYDQLILARCLAQLAEAPPARPELISLAHFPGAMRFIGLGQLPPEALRLLWEARQPVSPAQMEAGRCVWSLLRAPDPGPLAALAREGIAALPHLAGAVRRHCQELPWTGDGLGLTERLILRILAEGPRTVGETFRDLMLRHEPLPWLTDLMMQAIVERMKAAHRPVFTTAFEGEDRHWPRERLTINPLGRAVLAGEVDWLSLRPPERWLGGVRIAADAPGWRWEDGTVRVVWR